MQFREIDYGFDVQIAQVRNVQIGYVEQGEGEQTLLLIHGLGSNIKGWRRIIPELAKEYRVVAIDLPGYGYSSKEYYPYSLSFYAQVVVEFMDRLGLDNANCVGHSMGGQIAILMALTYPERVERLVLLAPAGIEEFEEGEKDWFRQVAIPELTVDATPRQIDVNVRRNFHDFPESEQWMIDDRIAIRRAEEFDRYGYAVAENIKAMVNEPTTDLLSQIGQPVLVLFGRYDQLIPNPFLHGGSAETIAEIADREIPNSTVRIIDDAGHFLQLEKPLVVVEEITSFLETTDR